METAAARQRCAVRTTRADKTNGPRTAGAFTYFIFRLKARQTAKVYYNFMYLLSNVHTRRFQARMLLLRFPERFREH